MEGKIKIEVGIVWNFYHRVTKTLSEAKKIAQTQLFSSFKSISFARDRNKNRQVGLSGERREGWSSLENSVGRRIEESGATLFLPAARPACQWVLHLFGLKVIKAIDVRSPWEFYFLWLNSCVVFTAQSLNWQNCFGSGENDQKFRALLLPPALQMPSVITRSHQDPKSQQSQSLTYTFFWKFIQLRPLVRSSDVRSF